MMTECGPCCLLCCMSFCRDCGEGLEWWDEGLGGTLGLCWGCWLLWVWGQLAERDAWGKGPASTWGALREAKSRPE